LALAELSLLARLFALREGRTFFGRGGLNPLASELYEALREAAFKERVKIHDIVLEGIGAALKRRGYPSIEELLAGKKR
jgi:hypothetical protein